MPFTEDDVLAALPPQGFLRQYMDYARKCTDAHASYHLGTGLALLAQTAPIDLHVPFGTPVYSNLFVLNVGPSSVSRKSASIGVARDLLSEAVPSGLGTQPGSREALVDSLRFCPRQVVIYSEFGSFLAQTEKGYLNPLKTAYTEAYDSSPLGRALVKQQGQGAQVNDPRLSLMCGCTVEYLERHTEPADWTGGFMARFLTFYAERERTYTVPPGDPAGRAQLIAYLKGLADVTSGGAVRGTCLGFDKEAREFWDDWYLKAINNNGAPEVAGAIARGPIHGLRAALLFAWDYGQARSGNHWYITKAELEPAKRIVELHIDSVIRIGEHLAPTRDMRERRVVLLALKGGRPRRLGQIVDESKLLLRRVKELLESLLEEGRIVRVLGKRGDWFRLASEAERTADFEPPVVDPNDTRPDAQVIQFPTTGSSSAESKSDSGSEPVSAVATFGAPSFAPDAAPIGFAGGKPVFSIPATPISPAEPTRALTWGAPLGESPQVNTLGVLSEPSAPPVMGAEWDEEPPSEF